MIYVVHARDDVCHDLCVCISDQRKKVSASVPDHSEFKEVDAENCLCGWPLALSREVVEMCITTYQGCVYSGKKCQGKAGVNGTPMQMFAGSFQQLKKFWRALREVCLTCLCLACKPNWTMSADTSCVVWHEILQRCQLLCDQEAGGNVWLIIYGLVSTVFMSVFMSSVLQDERSCLQYIETDPCKSKHCTGVKVDFWKLIFSPSFMNNSTSHGWLTRLSLKEWALRR